MTKIVNDNVAEYYDRQSQHYVELVRDQSAYRREISRRELAFVLKHLKPNAKVLEIGCGPGFFTRELVKRAESVMATDISEKMVNALQKRVSASNLSTMCVDVYDLDKVPHYGEYDTVVCMRALCHVDDAGRGLSKLRGAIHPQGNVIFDLLNDFSYIHFGRKLLGRPLRHTKYYPVKTMRKLIEQAGFEVTDSFGRGYPYIGGMTLDKIGYQILPDLAHGVGFNIIPVS